MAKNVNIHLKTTGAGKTKADLDQAAAGARKVGSETDKMGAKARTGSGKLRSMLGKLIGPLGFAAVAGAIAGAAKKVAEFFDDLKRRCDEAVRNVQELRTGYDSLFEALGAFDEQSRVTATKDVAKVLQETSVPEKVGLPVIDAYTRQFKGLVDAGRITQTQYDEGLKGMLSYAARHGGAATPDLIALMRGWEMVTPEEQGGFRRQVAAGAAAVGLTDEQMITALGRGMPTIKAMGWTPEQAVETIGTIAAGETGRKRASLPATTLQALMAPQPEKLEEYGIDESLASQQKALLEAVAAKRAEMEQERFVRMLTDIYGTEAGAGVFKLVSGGRPGLAGRLAEAASEAGREAERAEEKAYQTTLEARDARTKAFKRRYALDVTEEEKAAENLREIGEAAKKRYQRREPVRQWFRELFTWGNQAEAEEALYHAWVESLSEEERRRMGGGRERPGPLRHVWEGMTPGEKWEAITSPERRTGPPERTAAPTRSEPEPLPQLPAEGIGPVSAAQPVTNIDNRIQQFTIHNPVAGMDRVDLGIEPPDMSMTG